MLKMVANLPDGGSVLVCGLSALNIKRLQEGKPIIVKRTETGLPVEVVIFAGENERDMLREFGEMIGPDTKLKIDPRTTDA